MDMLPQSTPTPLPVPQRTVRADGFDIALTHAALHANTVTKLRASDMSIVQTIGVGSHPIGVTYEPSTRRVWVACYSGEILVFTS